MTALAALLTPVGLLNAVAGSPRVAETRGIAFGPGRRDRLDLYAPTRAAPTSLPTVVFFYGGGWEDGERGMYRFVGAALAARGIAVAVPDYRVFPETVFPGFLEDAARAVAWVRDHIAGFGGDPQRLVLMGHSAGAHIAAMLALDPRWLAAVGIDRAAAVHGLVGLAGPYDFLPLHAPTLEAIFGPEPGRGASQPINFVDAGAPPALLLTARGDRIVDPGNTTRLAARLRSAGVHAEVTVYPYVSHETLVGAFARPLRFLAPVLRDSTRFVARVTSPGAQLSRAGTAVA